MVNLLFISNSPKMENIKNVLQPLLTVKIEIVNDFDYGLKDVFEKRPATVFIQDHIAGVTGESVARHIQMLLGKGAPHFIFLHDEHTKAKPIKGLFEHLLDLSQPEAKLISDIQSILKSILGPQWDKIYIPPKGNTSAALSADILPVFSDQQVDDLLSNLEITGPAPDSGRPHQHDFSDPERVPENQEPVITSQQDQLADMLIESARFTHNAATAVTLQTSTSSELPKTPLMPVTPIQSIKREQTPAATPAATKPVVTTASRLPLPAQKPPVEPKAAAVIAARVTVKSTEVPVSPADFKIAADSAAEEIPHDLLRAFEENYNSQVRKRKRYLVVSLVVVFVCALGGWYLYQHISGAVRLPKIASTSTSAKTPQAAPSVPAKQVDMPASKPVPPERKASEADAGLPLPSFVPRKGFDAEFSSANPGWERYLTAGTEFRLFRSGDKIRALQVMALNKSVIAAPVMKAVLVELTGTDTYKVTSREKKSGYELSRATLSKSSELLVYRSGSTIRAFVVTLD